MLVLMENAGGHDQHSQATHRAIEQAVRDSYGRLLAFLSARSRDVAGAETRLPRRSESRLKPGRAPACRRNRRPGCSWPHAASRLTTHGRRARP